MIDEGYVKFRSVRTPGPPLDHAAVAGLIRWRRPLFDAGLVGHDETAGVGYGNLSVRDADAGRFIVSGTGTGHLSELGPEHFALVTAWDIAANSVASTGPAEPSSESLTHAAIYALDTAIRAVVHVHSDRLWRRLKGEWPTTGEDVAYGTPGMARAFARLHRDSDFATRGIAVMGGHEGGLIGIGNSIREATERILSIHQACPGGSVGHDGR